ncbi:LacI family transcriptional regulator [Streptomyces sp. NBC_01795]|nr:MULTISPECIES: LacI family DNA-binding transcriptional regulator [unclassified Streptomyces]WSA96404.1 LacI family transcriptional regulator [Streptomyces sp. NBC_01795]WSB80816.1 LacI family transcriptional regulator [Streptomyces sp. NBC_01775]WSS10975.1 LacI family transcriptional regulator [Streptomyces sp. NBC_01186]WSS39680.1 LacI family transcriptional regulator [Streptomyces sp. NBC_01187]
MKDVAERAGVSSKTVSRVFNNDLQVTEETRQAVLDAFASLGYRLNRAARSLRVGGDYVIAMAVESIADPFFAAMTEAVERTALERGAAVLVSSIGRDAERERQVIEGLMHRQISGLLAVAVGQDQSYLAPHLADMPMVFVDRGPVGVDTDAVVTDNFEAAASGSRHLIRQGHRRIAFLGDSPDVPTTRERFAGYRYAMEEAGLAVVSDLVADGCPSEHEAANMTARLLALEEPPTAVFSSNARCSIGLVPALHAQRRTDVAVVSFGDFPMASTLVPGITVLEQDPERIGRVAAERLLERMETPDLPVHRTVVAAELIPRGSGELPPDTTGRGVVGGGRTAASRGSGQARRKRGERSA